MRRWWDRRPTIPELTCWFLLVWGALILIDVIFLGGAE